MLSDHGVNVDHCDDDNDHDDCDDDNDDDCDDDNVDDESPW